MDKLIEALKKHGNKLNSVQIVLAIIIAVKHLSNAENRKMFSRAFKIDLSEVVKLENDLRHFWKAMEGEHQKDLFNPENN